MEINEKNKIETEESIWDSYKNPLENIIEIVYKDEPEKVNGKMSAGLFQQIQQSNAIQYKHLTEKDLEDALLSLYKK